MHVKESDYKSRPLKTNHRNHHVQGNRTQTILLQKRHQKAKPDKDHNMNILECCKMNVENELKDQIRPLLLLCYFVIKELD